MSEYGEPCELPRATRRLFAGGDRADRALVTPPLSCSDAPLQCFFRHNVAAKGRQVRRQADSLILIHCPSWAIARAPASFATSGRGEPHLLQSNSTANPRGLGVSIYARFAKGNFWLDRWSRLRREEWDGGFVKFSRTTFRTRVGDCRKPRRDLAIRGLGYAGGSFTAQLSRARIGRAVAGALRCRTARCPPWVQTV